VIQLLREEKKMLQKIVITGVLLLLIIPFHSSVGISNIVSSNDKNQMKYSSFLEEIGSVINTIDNSILYDYLEKIVSFGIRYVGSENITKAAEYMNNEFQSFGLESFIDIWKFPRYKCQNVIATKKGTDSSSDAVIVLSAHLDTTKNSVGANDDATGIATILTIANLISNFQFNHTIKFVAFSGEEVGLYGSFDYVKKAYSRGENIIANINLDTIGNSTCGNIIQTQIPDRSKWLLDYANEVNKKYEDFIDLKIQLFEYFPDDSRSFIEYGYDSISFVQPKVIEYPYHTPEDTLDKIDFEYYENVTKLILVLTVELAFKKIDLQVRFETPMEGYIYFLDRPILKLSGYNIVRTGLRGMTYFIGRPTARIKITTDEEIIGVSYSIDGIMNFHGIFTKPPYDWKIQKNIMMLFKLKGLHKIGVRVNTISGKTAYDEMDFYAITRI
jgi:hypothetical protein